MMYHRAYVYISLVLTVILTSSVANGDTSVCTGYPKTFNGLPCASTTRYWDGQMGACGCGTGDTSPFAWQYTKLTAAGSPPIFGSGTWCGSGCGKCFQLTPTGVGASPIGAGSPNTKSVVIKVTNLCPPDGNAQWCSYDVNSYGYDAHFDLMDYNMNGLITSMGWDNPEVTYQEVDCDASGFVDWGCQCASAADTDAANSTETTTTTTTTTTKPISTTTTTTKPVSTTTTTTTTKKPTSSTTRPSSSTEKPSSSKATKAPKKQPK